MPLLDALPLFGPWRVKRDAKKFQQWSAFTQSGPDVFQIVGIRKSYPRKGLKAFARWLDGRTCAVWIQGAWPNVGTFISAEGGYGHGEHHHEEVFYVNRIIALMDAGYLSAVRRHQKRANTSA